MSSLVRIILLATVTLIFVDAFSNPTIASRHQLAAFVNDGPSSSSSSIVLRASSWNDDESNAWKNDVETTTEKEDWQTVLKRKNDGSYWSDFDTLNEEKLVSEATELNDDYDEAEEEEAETVVMLNTLASLQASEVVFNVNEAKRADMQRQMEEWGFDADTIASSLNVATQERQEETMESLNNYYQEETSCYLLEEDLATIESHKNVARDPETNEPIRSQMVYVDEHACIGCTNCAMIAQSTFFMEEENGRARVFEQWGDDETTVEIARQTCPVECIHYIPYEELVRLEIQRRDQHINVLAGLVSRAERGAGSGNSMSSQTPRSFGSRRFTDAPQINRRGYGTTLDDPEFEAKEKLRLFKARRMQLEDERRQQNKIVDL